MNGSLLIDLLKEHDRRCMNTFFQKPNNKKVTYRHVWTRGMQGPWDTERYSELDFCLVFRRWANSIKNVESDSLTNASTDHLALNVTNSQQLKALVEAEHGKELRGAKSESEQQTVEYNEIIKEHIREGESEDMASFMETLAKAAEEN